MISFSKNPNSAGQFSGNGNLKYYLNQSKMLTCSGSLLLSLVTLGQLVTGHKQKVETLLSAKWKPTSPISEAAEFLSDIDPGLFWKFLDTVIEKQESFPLNSANDDVESDMASVSAFNLISPAKLRMMEWSLTSRAYSPRVHMLQELAPPADSIPKGCTTFAQYGNGEVTCDLDELEATFESGRLKAMTGQNYITDQDHKYPSYIWNEEDPQTVILYGHPSYEKTKQFHEFLKTKAEEVGYIFRAYKPATDGTLLLAGYGAELQFKSTEYVAQDDTAKTTKNEEVGGFLFDKLNELHPDLSEQLDKFQNYLTTEKGKQAGFEALKAWQVQELGIQASHYTTLQDNILESLLDISGNFPSRAGSLSSIRVPNEFKKSISQNQKLIQSHFNLDEGEGSFFIQGNQIDPDSLDLFTFMDTVKLELDLMESLRSIYNDLPQTRTKLNSYLRIGNRGTSDPELALDLRDSSIYWINDLEKDEDYEDWPEDLTQLFFRMGGIMLRPVRRNVFNLLLSLDPEEVENTAALLKLAQSFMAHKAPLRVGVVFCSEGHGELSNALDDEVQTSRADVIRRVMNHAMTEGKIRNAFTTVVNAFERNDFSRLLKNFNETGEEFDFGGELACEFVRKSGRPAPGAFLNGIPLKWDSVDDFEEIVLNQLLREAQIIQTEAYTGKIRDGTDIFEYLMNKPHVQTRLNDKILDTTNAKYVPFGNEIWEPGKDVKNPAAALAARLHYIVPPSKRIYPVSITTWILADITTPDGHTFLQTAVEFLQESSTHSRIAFIPTDNKRSAFKTSVMDAMAGNDLKALLRLLRNSKHEESGKSDKLDEKVEAFLKLIGFPRGSKGVVANGRIIGPISSGETFELGDWALLEKFSYDTCAKHFDDAEASGDISMRICSLMSSPKIKGKNSKRFNLPEFDSPITVNLPKDEELDPYYLDIKAVIDPASRHAHKMSALLTAIVDALSQWVKIQIIYNPPSKHSELPLKSYFRYIAGNNPGEKIVFEQIPREPLFTQNLIAPDNWMVEVVKGVNDPDNIRLQDLEGSVTSEFELANLLVEGHCLELKTGSPPRGLQFTLNPQNQGIKAAETIVMANLGYFQLKAHPGAWKLNLREGPSMDIFSIESTNTKPILVDSFQSVVVKVKVKRNPGMESVSLLESEEESGGGWFGFGNKKDVDDDTINVFSLASGHLYERLLKIMMLSVLKNTKSKVKFWFLKNYLSPTIKDVLPHMAKEYGFEYELVQYTWPRWLNAQREKQRIIWGYKILFLDVLFPLSLKKIVFVDADQIVRTDLKELFDLDLEGNPYGYTPFCDSRKEMDGFRFWNQGYWRNHLGRRKYHISALYVVDLVRFRKVAAGDRLRGQYQALSQDPNSLSNLDQDLPNNMIHQVGIKSLPQEWLWCETWCDDASKAQAKTIDLCNNPLTKESKLDAAQRIVPEWKDYDSEIRQFQNRLQLERSSAVPHPEDNAHGRDEL